MQVEGTAARLVPARQQPAMAGGDDLAQLARQRARFRPLPRHRRVEPRLFVIEIEMPRDAAGTPRRGAEPRHLPAGPLTVSRLRSQSV